MNLINSPFAEAIRDRYVLERELGRGGMATVYLARDLKHERPVALKLMHPELAATVGPERFLREIRTMARLDHPHILPVLDSGEAVGQLWYAMPYVRGESLRDRLRREVQLPVDTAVDLARQIASALDLAHHQGVVHRDLKPENILLADEQVRIADFGIAKALGATQEGQLTETGLALGTPAYMSPEQATGGMIDARSDVYALGCVVYEMLVGEPPYTGPTAQAIIMRRLTDPIPSVRRTREAVAENMDSAIATALAKAPADRFPSAGDFARALHALAAEQVTRVRSQQPPLSAAALAPTPAEAGPPAWSLPEVRKRVAFVVVLACGAIILTTVARHGGGPQLPTSGPAKMIAVLPLKNLGPSDDEYFADGLTEEITSRLTSIGDLGVISRTSADRYRNTAKPLKEIGRELGVGYILEGSVRWEHAPDGSRRVRVTPQLIEVATDRHLWADQYDANLADVFKVQSDIAGKVASSLGVSLGGAARRALAAQPTTNLKAYELYLRGRQLSRTKPAPSEEAVRLYEQAVALDSTFAQAYVALGRANVGLYAWRIDRTQSRRARAEAALAAALRLQPDLADAWQAQGEYYTEVVGDHGRALRSLNVADSLGPNDAVTIGDLARLEINQGHFDQALEHARRAVSLSPRDDWSQLQLGRLLAWMRDYAQADRHLSAAVGLAPEDPYGWRWKAYALRLAGDTTAERQVLREAIARLGVEKLLPSDVWADFVVTRDSTLWEQLGRVSVAAFESDTDRYLEWQAKFASLKGLTQRARAYADSVRRRHEAALASRPADGQLRIALAQTYLLLGRPDDAVREAERAVEVASLEQGYLTGLDVLQDLALIYARVGRKESAVRTLDRLLRMPSSISRARLRVDPVWSSLRDYPGFERLVRANQS